MQEIEANNQLNIVIYQAQDGELSIDVKLDNDTVWLTQDQMAELFNKARNTVTEHINNIFKEGELVENSVCQFFRRTASDGKSYEVKYYNLDVVISVGYRVKSKEGTQFRIWATRVLREHLVQGFTINSKQLQNRGLQEFEKAIALIKNVVSNTELTNDQSLGLLDVITKYAGSWILLQKYDENNLSLPSSSHRPVSVLDYNEAKLAIKELRNNLSQVNETMGLFGNEREHMLEGIVGNIYYY